MATPEEIKQSLSDLPLRVHCKRAYKGTYVDVRSTEAKIAQSRNCDIIVTCDTFPNQQMTIKCDQIESSKSFENENLTYGNPPYSLKAYKFIPD